jgi:DNA-binding beta-propeller fold protein YncE
MIDGETNEVSSTADIPDFTKWTWNDDNNYFDGTNVWLGMKHPDTNEVEVIALNLDTLELSARIAIGPDSKSLYLGQANEDGILLVGKMGFNQVIEIDTKNFTVGNTWDIPTGEDGVVCDVDVAQGSDGVERAFIPTDKSDMVLSINTATGEVLAEFKTSESGIRPFMLTASPDGKTVWVQERGSNGNVVLDAITLEPISRVPTGENAIMNTFSPDGTVSYTAHSKDTVVVANSVEAPFTELWRATVGTSPSKVAVHPNGEFVYATISKEAAVAVIDAATGEVVQRIEMGTDPNTVFVRERA